MHVFNTVKGEDSDILKYPLLCMFFTALYRTVRCKQMEMSVLLSNERAFFKLMFQNSYLKIIFFIGITEHNNNSFDHIFSITTWDIHILNYKRYLTILKT